MGDNNIFENAEVIEEVAEVGIKNTGKKIAKCGLIGGAVAVVGFATYKFIVKPLVKKHKDKKAGIIDGEAAIIDPEEEKDVENLEFVEDEK